MKIIILAVTSIAVCLAGKIPASKYSEEVKPRYPFLEVDPLTARALLDNDFESGIEEPWYDSSPNTVHWVVEDFSSPAEGYSPPAPLNGAKYLRATRDAQRTAGQVILRTVTFTALPGDEISFDFWIRSRYTGANALDLVLSVDDVETTLISLSGYSTSVNLEWRRSSVSILDIGASPTDVTLIFYAYCGGNTDDAIALDNIVLTPV
ncbi:hypothetical protein DAPPUDRAFT_237901 [Daphnia pulex]|uniref:MAM domain-containing protein n=1 Tax=Daphnia pulex TaxID=6669 RepID=E9G4Q7_DAPPU|nr:hypothetical protein DAPPUDRAFT_237901 [Daphnia pulex]|eukprot:EFX85342.1 hypothetical protein DAPPUDRAFT_237901 [Daphnia pulex]